MKLLYIMRRAYSEYVCMHVCVLSPFSGLPHFQFLAPSKQTNRQVQTDSSKQTAPNKQLQTDSSKQTAPNRQLTDKSKQTAPNRHLQTDSSSLRGMWDPQKSPGSSGAEKLSIPNCFVFVLSTSGSPARFQFFWLLATLQLIDRQKQPCGRCLFNIPRACAGKWSLTDTSEEA